MNLETLRRMVAALAMAAFVTAAQANTIVNMANYGVGTFNPWLNPSDLDNSYLLNMITKYNGGVPTSDGEIYSKLQGSLTPNPDLPTSPGLSDNISILGSPLTKTITLDPNHGDYLIAGWDGKEGVHAVYWIHGLTGDIDLVNDVPGGTINPKTGRLNPFNNKGLSNIWISEGSTRVPDGGATLALLGIGLLGLGAMRRKVG